MGRSSGYGSKALNPSRKIWYYRFFNPSLKPADSSRKLEQSLRLQESDISFQDFNDWDLKSHRINDKLGTGGCNPVRCQLPTWLWIINPWYPVLTL